MNLPRPLRLARKLPSLAASVVRHGLPRRTLLFGPLSLGDELLCTTVLREARRRGSPFAMMTNRPELFLHNSDPLELIPIDDYFAQMLRRLGRRVVQPYYSEADPADSDRNFYPPGHVLAEMCRKAGLRGEVTLRPYLHLSAAERAAGKRAERQIAFQSSASAAAIPSANKEWGPSRIAAAVQRLPAGYTAIQLGAASDPPLPATIDLRGKTTLRQAAAVLAASHAFIGLEGFLAHLARAVECPAVIVLGGRVKPETFGYPGNEYLSAPTPCTPCGRRNGCDFGRACLEEVPVQSVVGALHRILARGREPLPAATALL